MQDRPTVIEYSHQPLNQEIVAIGGRYILIKEVRLKTAEQEVLYQVGCAMVDSSCCGPAGCGYAVVQGFVRDWQYRRDERGLPVTRVERIQEPAAQAEIGTLIRKKELVTQVNFL
ncbi:MAG: hypothetical protein ACOZF0_20440 [Thermodesulfobacteriota bacterium]